MPTTSDLIKTLEDRFDAARKRAEDRFDQREGPSGLPCDYNEGYVHGLLEGVDIVEGVLYEWTAMQEKQGR